MKLKILTVANKKEEAVILSVNEDCNLGNYAIADNTYSESKLTNVHRHVYFFPNQPVKKDDVIVLHAGVAANRSEEIAGTNNKKWHFYTQSESNVWNDAGDTAHLIYYGSLQKIPVPAKKKLVTLPKFKRKFE